MGRRGSGVAEQANGARDELDDALANLCERLSNEDDHTLDAVLLPLQLPALPSLHRHLPARCLVPDHQFCGPAHPAEGRGRSYQALN